MFDIVVKMIYNNTVNTGWSNKVKNLTILDMIVEF